MLGLKSAKPKVWVVTCGTFDDVSVRAVYSTKDAAASHVQRAGMCTGTLGRREPCCVAERFEVDN